MDELWQRYRTFWTPVLIGMGVFLVGLIVVFIVNDDPSDVNTRVSRAKRTLEGLTQPAKGETDAIRGNAEARTARVKTFAQRVDQTGLAADPLAEAVGQALRAAILRGDGGEAAFDGDTGALESARRRYERTLHERLELLRTGDPNVGWGRVLSDVWSELRVRANRADVDLNADQLGFGQLPSVNRSNLLQRLLNLALVARATDLAIRHGARSVDEVRFVDRANTGPESFLQEWPVTVTITGDVESFRPLLNALTDETRTTALGETQISPPARQSSGEGIVSLRITMSSVRVRPEASLELATEEGA
jgi:hypothetical protein